MNIEMIAKMLIKNGANFQNFLFFFKMFHKLCSSGNPKKILTFTFFFFFSFFKYGRAWELSFTLKGTKKSKLLDKMLRF